MPNRLQNKVVLVTGAAQGIGFGSARLAAAEGAAVVLADIQKDRGEQAAATLRAEGAQALFLPVDLRDESQCAALIDQTIRAHGKLDGLVNNAGWFPRATLEQTTTELWEEVLHVNLRSAFYCCKYAVPKMSASITSFPAGSSPKVNSPSKRVKAAPPKTSAKPAKS